MPAAVPNSPVWIIKMPDMDWTVFSSNSLKPNFSVDVMPSISYHVAKFSERLYSIPEPLLKNQWDSYPHRSRLPQQMTSLEQGQAQQPSGETDEIRWQEEQVITMFQWKLHDFYTTN